MCLLLLVFAGSNSKVATSVHDDIGKLSLMSMAVGHTPGTFVRWSGDTSSARVGGADGVRS